MKYTALTLWTKKYYQSVGNSRYCFIILILFFTLIYPTKTLADTEKDPSLPDVYGIRHTIEIDAAVLTIGNIFKHAGIYKDIALFRTPKPGETAWLDVTALVSALKRHDIRWFRPKLPNKILIKRNGKRINSTMLQKTLLKKMLAEKLLTKKTNEIIEFVFLRPIPPFYVSQSETGGLEILKINTSVNNDLVSATIRARDLDEGQDFKILAQIEKKIKIPVLKKGAIQGIILKERMITYKTFNIKNIQNNVHTSIKDMLNLVTKKDIQAQNPIYKNDLEIKKVIKANDIVRVIYSISGLSIEAKARALENGVVDEMIEVKNIRSGQILKVKIVNNGIVKLIK